MREQQWRAGCMGFLRVRADSFLYGVASPFHSFVTTYVCMNDYTAVHKDIDTSDN